MRLSLIIMAACAAVQLTSVCAASVEKQAVDLQASMAHAEKALKVAREELATSSSDAIWLRRWEVEQNVEQELIEDEVELARLKGLQQGDAASDPVAAAAALGCSVRGQITAIQRIDRALAYCCEIRKAETASKRHRACCDSIEGLCRLCAAHLESFDAGIESLKRYYRDDEWGLYDIQLKVKDARDRVTDALKTEDPGEAYSR